jgi:hypothetical protein
MRWTSVGRLIGLAALTAGVSGVSCTIRFPDDGGSGLPPGGAPLDETDAEIRISRAQEDAQAIVNAAITTSSGRSVVLAEDQAVLVEGVELAREATGLFRAEVESDAQYTITVREPTRGVENTVVIGPDEFGITAPGAGGSASLSGFTLAWTEPDDGQSVEIELSQTVFGETTVREFDQSVDNGQRTFAASELRDFVQGAELLITVRKVRATAGLAGFASGIAVVELSVSKVVDPGP